MTPNDALHSTSAPFFPRDLAADESTAAGPRQALPSRTAGSRVRAAECPRAGPRLAPVTLYARTRFRVASGVSSRGRFCPYRGSSAGCARALAGRENEIRSRVERVPGQPDQGDDATPGLAPGKHVVPPVPYLRARLDRYAEPVRRCARTGAPDGFQSPSSRSSRGRSRARSGTSSDEVFSAVLLVTRAHGNPRPRSQVTSSRAPGRRRAAAVASRSISSGVSTAASARARAGR